MTDRSTDIIDLRCSLDGYAQPMRDRMHTTALTDTSQNPGYGASTAENRGLVSCITPAGQFFMYCKGRIITGPEKWALNGLLANDGQLKLGCLTEVNMGDMAGNAMSLTVINAAMMSALCIKQLDRFRKKNKKGKKRTVGVPGRCTRSGKGMVGPFETTVVAPPGFVQHPGVQFARIAVRQQRMQQTSV